MAEPVRARGATSVRRLVAVVDDSESVLESLPALLKQVGFDVEAFASAEAFLASGVADRASCLILDVKMPQMGGLELRRELVRRGKPVPTVFITGQADRSLLSRLAAAGAAACLLKPFSDTDLLEAVDAALGGRRA